MAKTYSMCVGNRGVATRCGGNDGVHVAAQSYDGSIIVKNYYDENNTLKVIVGTNDGSSCYINDTEFRGTFEEFNNLLKLAHDIKLDKVSITRHRAKSNRMLKLERAFRD